jgi:GH24 family phage-related lysozyme (muramidase)
MHASVLAVFPSFTSSFEGRIPYMYQDILGLVTVGLGCLIDPSPMAQGLPWVRISDGKPATPNEIDAEWRKIKMAKGLAKQGHLAAKRIASLKLLDAGIDTLARGRLMKNDAYLAHVFPDFQQWPADAQLATHSMAWAMGAGFVWKFPYWTAAAKIQGWAACAQRCLMRTTGNPGLVPRNHANVKLFKSATTNSELPIEVLRGYP